MPQWNVFQSESGRLFRYARKDFSGSGQDSFSDPPSQDPDMFESLVNVLPPVSGNLLRRWGYSSFNTTLFAAPTVTHAAAPFVYQNDATNTRKFVFPVGTSIKSTVEAGTVDNTSLLTVTGQPARGANSRSFAYIATGTAADQKKWDGSASGGTSKWGIVAAALASSGPLNPSAAVGNDTTFGGVNAWTNPTNVFSSNNIYATATAQGSACGGPLTPQTLRASGFGFALPANVEVMGIQVEVEYSAASGPCGFQAAFASLGISLGKAGVLIAGTQKTFGGEEGTFFDGIEAYRSFGASNDLWSSTWNSTELNETGFSVGISLTGNNAAISVDHIRVTVTFRAAIGIGAPVAGAVTLTSGRKYFYVGRNSITNQLSDLSPVSLSTGSVTAKKIPLSGIAAFTDSQVDRKIVLATADGGDETTLFELVDLPNATTTYDDDTPEATLLLRNVYNFFDEDIGDERGVAGNLPPPDTLQFPTKHRGRIVGLVGSKLHFTKSEDELLMPTGNLVGKFEECWPAENFFDISEGAEIGRGILSDGQVLYVGTEKRIIKLFGQGPEDFEKPESLFAGVGILNQDVWKIVFLENNPVGAMWLTPDYRVIGSDFNTYQNVGTPIQDTLDSINRTVARNVSWAMYAATGFYNLYILAVPTGTSTKPDTLLVHDLTSRKWSKWTTIDKLIGGFYTVTLAGVPLIVIIAENGKIYQFAATTTQDRVNDTPVSFQCLAQTSWLDMEAPQTRKILNELDLQTGDSANMLVTVDGASTNTEFATPAVVVSGAAPVVGPLGELKVFLASSASKDRFYRLKFAATSTSADFLSYCALEFVPLHNI